MRTHRAFPGMQPWSSAYADDRDLLTAENLVSMRVEPVLRARIPSAAVDLHFARDGRNTCVPLVYVDLAQLDLREADPLVFPDVVALHIDDAHLAELLERVVPDLEARAYGGGFWAEELIVYRADALVAAARDAALFGAAPLARSIPAIAPAIYARHFTIAKHVLAHGPGASALAAFVRADSTSTVLVDDPDVLRGAWYRVAPGTPDARVAYAIAIGYGEAPAGVDLAIDATGTGERRVTVAAPLPADLLVLFDPPVTESVGSFGVTSHRSDRVSRADVAEPIAVGGSGGIVAIVVRADAFERPDADLDEALALASVLRAEGFGVEVVARRDALDEVRPDLVHLFGVFPGAYAADIADWALEHRVPLAAHAYFEAPTSGGFWGASVAPYCFNYSPDDRNVQTYLGLLARRMVEVDGVSAAFPYAPPSAGLESAERVLRIADVVFVNSERERLALEALRAGKPTFVVPPVAVAAVHAGPAADIATRVGHDPFVLVHAPIGPEANQLLIARAMATVGVPAVFAGPVADPVYAERVREFAPDVVRLLAEPDPAECRALYRGAAVFADASWVRRGQARVVSAAALGTAIVVPGEGWVELPLENRYIVDPADVESIALGIGEAWDLARRSYDRQTDFTAVARERLAAAHLAIVSGYAKIGQTV